MNKPRLARLRTIEFSLLLVLPDELDIGYFTGQRRFNWRVVERLRRHLDESGLSETFEQALLYLQRGYEKYPANEEPPEWRLSSRFRCRLNGRKGA